MDTISNIAKGAGSKAATTPASKRKVKGDGESGDMETTPTPKKRKSPVKKKVIKNASDEEDAGEIDMPILHDTSGDDDLTTTPGSTHSYDFYE